MRVLVLAALLFSANGLTAAGAQLISSEPHPSQSAPSLAGAWEDLSEEKRQRIEDYLRMKLGLSSTGRVQLMGVYRVDSLGESRELVHIQQLDLMGARLCWSVLVDPDAMSAKVLYHVDKSYISTSFVPMF
jgi:hypothetical protein